MVNHFIDRWTKKESEPSLASKIKNVAKPTQDLKEQIGVVIQRLDFQTQSLDRAVKRFEIRDADIFQRVVKAMTERDTARANILATELGEIRKVEKMLSHASLALTECFYAAQHSFRNGRCSFSVESCKKHAEQHSLRNVQYSSRGKSRTWKYRKSSFRHSYNNPSRQRYAREYYNGECRCNGNS